MRGASGRSRRARSTAASSSAAPAGAWDGRRRCCRRARRAWPSGRRRRCGRWCRGWCCSATDRCRRASPTCRVSRTSGCPSPRRAGGRAAAGTAGRRRAPPTARVRSGDREADAGAGERSAGPLAALLAALRWAPQAAWILCPCDLPRVSPAAVAWLLGERRPHRLAVLPRADAGRSAGAALRALRAGGARCRGSRSPPPVAARRTGSPRSPGVAVVGVPPPLVPCWRDADTPQELARLLAEMDGRGL